MVQNITNMKTQHQGKTEQQLQDPATIIGYAGIVLGLLLAGTIIFEFYNFLFKTIFFKALY